MTSVTATSPVGVTSGGIMAALARSEKNGLVMSGYLFYKIKKCQKYWAELHRETSNHPRELRLFQSKSKADDYNSIFESIVLSNILEICDKQRSISGHPVFQIVSIKMRHQFCAESKQELDHWVEGIRQELFGLPQVGIIYEFMVMVIDNPSAKKYSLIGKYTLKVDDKNIMLYSANGLIPTNFSVSIEQIWRLKLAPSADKDSIYSNFVVLDIMGGGVLLLMSSSSTDIARIVSHRRRLLSGYKQHETTGEAIHGSYHGNGKKSKTTPSSMPCVCASYDSPLLQKRFLEFELLTEDPIKLKLPKHSTSHGSLQNGRSDNLKLSTSSHNTNEAVFKNTGSPKSPEIGKYRDGTISRRPPQPIPRSPNNLRPKTPMDSPSNSPCYNSSSDNGTVTEDDDDDDDYVQDTPVPKAEYLAVFNEEDHSDEELYSYAYDHRKKNTVLEDKDVYYTHDEVSYSYAYGHQKKNTTVEGEEDVYFITNDEVLELRRNIKPRGNRSIKGSKSMENLAY